LQLFEQAAAAGDGQLGLAGLAGPLTAPGSVRSDPLVRSVLQPASRIPGGLEIDQTGSRFGAPAHGVASLGGLVGALMGTEALTREIATTAEGIGHMLDRGAIDGALSSLGSAAASTDLAGLIASASPDDPDEVAALAPRVIAFADAIRSASDRLVTG